MSDSSGRTHPARERAGSPLTVGILLVAVLIVGIGAFAAWRNSVSARNDRLAQNSRPATTAAIDVRSPATVPDAALPSLHGFQQTVAALQSSQRQILDEIDGIKQKIASEQGERKLLTNQLGSLSVRLDELSAASASIAERASTAQAQRSRAKLR
jgi:uncharacterized protein HemX